MSLIRCGSYMLGCPESLQESPTYSTNRISPFLLFHVTGPCVTAACSLVSPPFHSYQDHGWTLSSWLHMGSAQVRCPKCSLYQEPSFFKPSHCTSPSTVVHRGPHQPTQSEPSSSSVFPHQFFLFYKHITLYVSTNTKP